jgi:6-phosphofructokinase 1
MGQKKIAVLTAGGDCPGLNAAIASIVRGAALYNADVIGFTGGFTGLIMNDVKTLKPADVEGIERLGGTILGSSREKPFKQDGALDKPAMIERTWREHAPDMLLCIGGNGSMRTASRLAEIGIPVIGIPKTIDNDVWGTDQAIGFDTALTVAVESIDRIITTAKSHKRIMVVEMMGHKTGWLALHSGVASMADCVLIPELPFNPAVVAGHLSQIVSSKGYALVIVAEGIRTDPQWSGDAGESVARMIESFTGIQTRSSSLGYIQRGGSPSPRDRIIASRMALHAVRLAMSGQSGVMVTGTGDQTGEIPLAQTAGKLRAVDGDREMLRLARDIGISFGES